MTHTTSKQSLYSTQGLKTSNSTKDFNQAYLKLVNQMYNEQGATGLVTEEEVKRLQNYNNLNEKDFHLR